VKGNDHNEDSKISGVTVKKFSRPGDLAPGICAFLS